MFMEFMIALVFAIWMVILAIVVVIHVHQSPSLAIAWISVTAILAKLAFKGREQA